jgi:hypothetical protein
MQKTTVYLPDALYNWLREESRSTGRSHSEILCYALEVYAAQQLRPLPKSMGLGSDPELRGADVDDWLREHWRPG